MTCRRTSRKLSEEQQREQTALIEERQLDQLRTEFPDEIKEIANLRPLLTNADFIDPLLVKLSEIIYQYRNRYSNDYFHGAEQLNRSTKLVAEHVYMIMQRFAKLDLAHIESVFFVADKIFPRPFFEKEDLKEFSRLLSVFRTLMIALNAALKVGTGISDAPRGKGRPPSPYVKPALELIESWELITAERFDEDSELLVVKRVPTPKRSDASRPAGEAQRFETKQPSTAFIQIALRMIKPNIKDSEISTAIKKALKLRDAINELIQSKPPESFPRLLEWLQAKLEDVKG